jgi:hypothetical protein
MTALPNRRASVLLIFGGALTLGWCAYFIDQSFLRASARTTYVEAAILFPTETHDFGIVLANSTNEAEFVTTNKLSSSLNVDGITKSCGCTLASAAPIVVQPGQALKVHCMLAAADSVAGMSSNISVFAHSGASHYELKYRLIAEVQKLLNFPEEDGCLTLGSWSLDQLPASASIRVSRGGYPAKFDTLRAVSSSSALSPIVRTLDTNTWQIDYVVNKTDVFGNVGFPIRFELLAGDKPLPPAIDEQAYVQILGPIKAWPSSILLTLTAGQRLRQVISISPRSDQDSGAVFQLMGVSVDSKNAVVGYENKPNEALVNLDYNAPLDVPVDRGQIVASILYRGRPCKIRISYLAMISPS